MNMVKILTLNAVMLFFLACGGNENVRLFELQTKGNQFKQHETIEVSIKNLKDRKVKEVNYSIDGKALTATNGKITLEINSLGKKVLTAKVDYDDGTVSVTKDIKVLSANAPDIYTYEIVNEYPHDIKAYTQGLEFHNDTLYESTGHKGTSWVRKIDYKTGKILKQVDLDPAFFGEGITIMNRKIYQLTWQNGTGFIYNLDDFKKLDSFQYGESREGWGLANDGTKLFKSDGTEKIWFLNPDTLVEEGYLQIVTNKSLFNNANELEYVNGKLYANVYQKESMMIIDATSGAIEGVINFGGLKEKVTQHEKLDVLNGVAYHPKRNTFFVFYFT